jgi:predicted transcriptional regulator
MEITETEILDVHLQGTDKSTVVDSDPQIENVVKALSSSTRRNILMYLRQQPADVSRIAAELEMTEANISAQVKKLEEADLIKCEYASGQHGVRKISKIKYNQLLVRF